MSSKIPTTTQIAWLSIIPQFLVLGLLILIALLFITDSSLAIMAGAFIYLLLSITLRQVIAKDHNRGMRYIKAGNFRSAIPCYEASYQFFSKNGWLDKYRYLTLLSSSKISYKEMALCNIAFCYVQLGDLEKGREYYTHALNEFPNSILASTALKFFREE